MHAKCLDQCLAPKLNDDYVKCPVSCPALGPGKEIFPQTSLHHLGKESNPQRIYKVVPCLELDCLWTLSRGVLIYKERISYMKAENV